MRSIIFSLIFCSVIFCDVNSSIFDDYKEQKALDNYFYSSTKKVAVIPIKSSFKKQNKYPEANIKLTNSIAKSLWKKNKVIICNKNEVIKALTKFNLNPVNGLSEAQLYKLADELNVDCLIYGDITKYKVYTKIGLSLAKVVKIVCKISVYDFEGKRRIGSDKIATKDEAGDIISRTFSKTSEQERIDKIVEVAGILLTWYMPAPRKSKNSTLFNLSEFAIESFVGVKVDFSQYSEDLTWKMYPSNYFMENIGYTFNDYNRFK